MPSIIPVQLILQEFESGKIREDEVLSWCKEHLHGPVVELIEMLLRKRSDGDKGTYGLTGKADEQKDKEKDEPVR